MQSTKHQKLASMVCLVVLILTVYADTKSSEQDLDGVPSPQPLINQWLRIPAAACHKVPIRGYLTGEIGQVGQVGVE